MTGADPTRSVLVVQPSVQLYGADRMLAESVSALRDAGWRVVVAVPGDGPLVPVLAESGAEILVVESPVVRKAYLSPIGVLRYAAELLGALPRVLSAVGGADVDVVYVNTLTVPLWSVGARLRGVPVLCHVHEAEQDAPRLVRSALASPLALARMVLANSAASAEVITRDLPFLKDRMRVVYNGFDGPPGAVGPRRALDGTARLVLLGRLSPRKGTDVAVSALALLVVRGYDVALDLVGGVFPGYEWFEQQVRKQAAEAGVADRVRWCGETPDQWSALQAADIAVVPSRVEPFGNTAVEAMLAQRPLVASATQGLIEIVDDGRTGTLCAPGDATSLADAVRGLLDDWPAALERAQVAAAEAATRFSRQRYRDEVVAAVSAVASSARGRRTRARAHHRPATSGPGAR
jgi:glycosyltransferase involved in cell wall biosynthesis